MAYLVQDLLDGKDLYFHLEKLREEKKWLPEDIGKCIVKMILKAV